MAHTPGPEHHQPDVWPVLIWLGQNAWLVMAGICAWLVNVLYQLLISKRNEEVDTRLAAQDEKLDRLLEAVAEMRGEMRARNKS
jgi:hypothetical protein